MLRLELIHDRNAVNGVPVRNGVYVILVVLAVLVLVVLGEITEIIEPLANIECLLGPTPLHRGRRLLMRTKDELLPIRTRDELLLMRTRDEPLLLTLSRDEPRRKSETSMVVKNVLILAVRRPTDQLDLQPQRHRIMLRSIISRRTEPMCEPNVLTTTGSRPKLTVLTQPMLREKPPKRLISAPVPKLASTLDVKLISQRPYHLKGKRKLKVLATILY